MGVGRRRPNVRRHTNDRQDARPPAPRRRVAAIGRIASDAAIRYHVVMPIDTAPPSNVRRAVLYLVLLAIFALSLSMAYGLEKWKASGGFAGADLPGHIPAMNGLPGTRLDAASPNAMTFAHLPLRPFAVKAGSLAGHARNIYWFRGFVKPPVNEAHVVGVGELILREVLSVSPNLGPVDPVQSLAIGGNKLIIFHVTADGTTGQSFLRMTCVIKGNAFMAAGYVGYGPITLQDRQYFQRVASRL